MKATIRRVYVERMLDEYPDLSHLGEYGNAPTTECAIDRQERGDMERNQYRWFNPTLTGEQTGNPDSPEQDYQRMEAYNRGDWHMVGIRAVAEVGTESGTIQTLRSGGLWGIESDSGNEYFDEVGCEELAALRAELKSFGFSALAIAKAFHKVETVEG